MQLLRNAHEYVLFNFIQQQNIMVQALNVVQKQGTIAQWKRLKKCGQTCSQAQLPQWAKSSFKLQQFLNQGTISRILFDEKSFLKVLSHANSFKNSVSQKTLSGASSIWMDMALNFWWNPGERISGTRSSSETSNGGEQNFMILWAIANFLILWLDITLSNPSWTKK